MRKSRSLSKAVLGVAIVAFSLSTTRVGNTEIGAFIARAAAASERGHFVSPFGTIHAALFTLPRPTGSDMPDPIEYRLASLDIDATEITGSIPQRALLELGARNRGLVFPQVNRADKGDRLVPSEHAVAPAEATPSAVPTADPASVPPSDPNATPPAKSQRDAEAMPAEAQQNVAIARAPSVPADQPAARDAQVSIPDAPAAAPSTDANAAPPAPQPAAIAAASDDKAAAQAPMDQAARIYFGVEPMGMLAAMQPWSPDDMSILDQADEEEAARPAVADANTETVVAKGQSTAEPHLKSPAERLNLAGAARAKSEKCLANAIYFEARGESVRGQIAVAQVVMNRVFSGYYPDNVCGVVYQDAHRHLACQFTFACDGKRDRVDEPEAWTRAEEIARETLDGKLWLPDVGKATHYHAYWVRPVWIREMHKLDRIGVHTFYRPRNWGDGADAPVWGDAASTSEAVKKM
jgi:spore germination cell wall hydrolase CwlJ-like protein